MACSRLGSRVLEAVWSSASIAQRQSIAQELGNLNGFSSLIVNITKYLLRYDCFLTSSPAPCESQLKSDQFARHVWAKFALSHFVHRRAHWQEIQTGESKKRKLFSDILE